MNIDRIVFLTFTAIRCFWKYILFLMLVVFAIYSVSTSTPPLPQERPSSPEKSLSTEKKIPDPPPIQLPELQSFSWSLGGFKNVFIADFTIKNGSVATWKDILIACDCHAKSGTIIGTVANTVYEVVGPGKEIKVKGMSMGLVNPQTETARCLVVNAVEIK